MLHGTHVGNADLYEEMTKRADALAGLMEFHSIAPAERQLRYMWGRLLEEVCPDAHFNRNRCVQHQAEIVPYVHDFGAARHHADVFSKLTELKQAIEIGPLKAEVARLLEEAKEQREAKNLLVQKANAAQVAAEQEWIRADAEVHRLERLLGYEK